MTAPRMPTINPIEMPKPTPIEGTSMRRMGPATMPTTTPMMM